jgi:hypothetical protein
VFACFAVIGWQSCIQRLLEALSLLGCWLGWLAFLVLVICDGPPSQTVVVVMLLIDAFLLRDFDFGRAASGAFPALFFYDCAFGKP